MRLLAFAASLLFATPTISAPFEIVLHQPRAFRNTCTITIREPITDRVLGRYECVTGGLGRGSAPLGKYEIGEFQGTDFDPLHIGPRWLIHHVGPGVPDGYAWDIDLLDWRTELELHSLHPGRVIATLGCIGIAGGPKVYAEFMANLRFLIAWLGTVRFDLTAPSSSEPVALAIEH